MKDLTNCGCLSSRGSTSIFSRMTDGDFFGLEKDPALTRSITLTLVVASVMSFSLPLREEIMGTRGPYGVGLIFTLLVVKGKPEGDRLKTRNRA